MARIELTADTLTVRVEGDPAKSVVIDLTGDGYDQLVVEVDDPQATIASIQAVL